MRERAVIKRRIRTSYHGYVRGEMPRVSIRLRLIKEDFLWEVFLLNLSTGTEKCFYRKKNDSRSEAVWRSVVLTSARA
jgi:hypothetical protein